MKTLKVRVKDKHAKLLNQMARDVNFVFNYLNELSLRNIQDHRRFLSSYDMEKYLYGASRELSISSATLSEIAREYVTRRMQFRKARLNWRKSRGSRRSLGWVPFKIGSAKFKDGQVIYYSQAFDVWDSYGLDQFEFRSGSFNEDAQGKWYFNVVVEAKPEPSKGTKTIGIDLGLKDAATTSEGERLHSREYRELEPSLAIAQRAKKPKRVNAIHAKIKNRRKDALHKFSRKLVDESAAIFVGDVSSLKLAKTRMAKSVLDSGWGMLRNMLDYKCANAGVIFEVVDEANTTRTCSSCGAIPSSSPKGMEGLGMRRWTCNECGATHDRDVNAARNIAALGLEGLAEGVPA